MRTRVTPESQWRTDLFLTLILDAFRTCGGEWRVTHFTPLLLVVLWGQRLDLAGQ
jgi:hypothetical protein